MGCFEVESEAECRLPRKGQFLGAGVMILLPRVSKLVFTLIACCAVLLWLNLLS